MPKLLLADDSVTIQRVIELTFADEQIQVIAVGDGQEAVQRIESERPDVILADVGMPRRDGYEVAAHVKKTPHLKHIPVVLLTGAFEPIDEARARAVGCDGVLVKPFEPQMVINRVKDLLAGRRPSSLWEESGAASAAPPASAPPPEPPALEPQPRPVDSLDEYFDRLDAAFAQHAPAGQPAPLEPAPVPQRPVESATPAAAARTADFGDWDLPAIAAGAHPPPELAAPPPAVAAAPAARSAAPSPAGAAQETAPAAASVGTATLDNAVSQGGEAPAPGGAEGPALADAFAALLAAEQALNVRPVAASAAASAPVTDDVVEEVVRRVIARMSDQVVRETVLQVAERMVREEIDRVKKGAS